MSVVTCIEMKLDETFASGTSRMFETKEAIQSLIDDFTLEDVIALDFEDDLIFH